MQKSAVQASAVQRSWVFLVLCLTAFPNMATARPRNSITCSMVRAYVAHIGLEQARAIAIAHGMTPAQQRRATHCLEKRG